MSPGAESLRTGCVNASAGYPFADFGAAAHDVLRVLRQRLKLRLWMVTRAVGGDQIVLEAEDTAGSGYAVAPGAVLPWEISLCAQMVAGNGPLLAPNIDAVHAYALAGNRHLAKIRAYVGVPLRHPDGSLFGTLCGFDPDPQPDNLRDWEQFLLLQARLLATVLGLELEREHQRRRAERAEVDATLDALTELGNRRAWDDIVAAEEIRSHRYGHAGCVLMIDLNGLKAINDASGHSAGDDLLRQCAQVLAKTARDSDFVARVGGDEFGVLVVETDSAGGKAQAARIRQELRQAGIDAAVGLGVKDPLGSFHTAIDEADRAMYADKTGGREAKT